MNTKLRLMNVVTACILLTGCTSTHTAYIPLDRSESEIDKADVPEAAHQALLREADGRPITDFEREDRGSFIAYEAEWQDGDVEVEATVLADGSIVERERELTQDEFAQLPPAVLARVQALQQQGFEVEVARRVFYLYDIDAEKDEDDDPEGAAEQELLLRPDGSEVGSRPD